jgi:hypothetical protein
VAQDARAPSKGSAKKRAARLPLLFRRSLSHLASLFCFFGKLRRFYPSLEGLSRVILVHSSAQVASRCFCLKFTSLLSHRWPLCVYAPTARARLCPKYLRFIFRFCRSSTTSSGPSPSPPSLRAASR